MSRLVYNLNRYRNFGRPGQRSDKQEQYYREYKAVERAGKKIKKKEAEALQRMGLTIRDIKRYSHIEGIKFSKGAKNVFNPKPVQAAAPTAQPKPEPKPEPKPKPPKTVEPTIDPYVPKDPKDLEKTPEFDTSDLDDKSTGLNTQISDLTKGFQTQLTDLETQMEAERAEAAERMEEMKGSFAQALAAGSDRPRVEGIRFANRGTGGATQSQLQRRGVTGTFGRAGERLMKISSLNV